MELETEAYTGELNALRNAYKTLKPFLAEHFANQYFMSGFAGAVDENGLPEYILVCPAYGVDWVMSYKRTNEVEGPQW